MSPNHADTFCKDHLLRLCAARGACKKKEPAFPGDLIQFLNASLQQVPGFRKRRIAAGWVAPLVNYHLCWCSGTLHELQGQQLVVPFVKDGHFCHVCSEHLKYQSPKLCWHLCSTGIARYCLWHVANASFHMCFFSVASLRTALLLFHYLILSCIK